MFFTSRRLDADSIKIKIINNSNNQQHLTILEIENRVNVFRKYLVNYINIKRQTTNKMIKKIVDRLEIMQLFNYYDYSAELEGILTAVKEMIDDTLDGKKNLEFF